MKTKLTSENDEKIKRRSCLSLQKMLDNYVEQSRKALPHASYDPLPVERHLIKEKSLRSEKSKGNDKSKFLKVLY